MKLHLLLAKIFLLLLLCSIAGEACAQREIVHELQKKLAAAKDVKSRIDFSNTISYEMRIFSPDSALQVANDNLVLAEKENYKYGAAVATLCIGMANSIKGNFEIAMESGKKGLVMAENLNNDSLRAVSNMIISTAHYNKSNYDLSIEKALLAVSFYKKINNSEGITKARIGMAQVYQLKNDLPAAEKILKELSQEQRTDMKVQVNIMHTLANVYGMQEKYKEAFALDEKALVISEKNDLRFLTSGIYDNMANCYMYSGDAANAKKYFSLCIAIDSSFGNSKQMADTYLNLGQLSLMGNDYTGAIINLRHSITLSKLSGYKQGTYTAYLLLGKAFSKNNEKDSALAATNEGYKIKDSIINVGTENKIAEMETLYQSEKKEQELLQQKNEINKKNFLLTGSVVSILLITLSGSLYYRKRILEHKIVLQNEVLHQQDIASKAIIHAEENERKRIAADLHDGIGQMMSAAKMNLSVFEEELVFENDIQKKKFENVIALVDESCKELRNVSHQMMPNALLKSGLASAVKEFIAKIDSDIIRVNLHTEGLNERLEANVETVLYRVIQECVNNVLKHSGANHLDIAIIKDEEGIAATIEDNGCGFDTGKKEKFDGIGLKNILSRVKYLQGTIDFTSAVNKGTVVVIHLPA